jgi:hypothetical protein
MAGPSGDGSFNLARGAHAARAVHNPIRITVRDPLMVKAPSKITARRILLVSRRTTQGANGEH